jgi:putative transcriptional regulator
MPVRVNLDHILTLRGLTAKHVAQRIGLSETQLSQFRSGKVRGVRFGTLAKLCLVLECSPGDLLAYEIDIDDLISGDPTDSAP